MQTFIAKRAFGSSALLSLLFLNVPASFGNIVSSSFTVTQDSSGVNMTGVTSAQSVIVCGSTCMREGDCVVFCFDQTDDQCYVNSGSMASGVNVVIPSNTNGLRCFEGWCPYTKGYRLYEGRCVKLHTQAETQALSKDLCAQDGGQLYLIQSDSDEQIVGQIASDNGLTNFGAWVAAERPPLGTQFSWRDGSSLPAASGLWSGPNPDGLGSDQQYCVEIRDNLKLNDVYCHHPCLPFCQIDP